MMTATLASLLTHKAPTFVYVFMILLTPCAGLSTISLVLPMSAHFALQWPYLSKDLVYGMSIFLCMPTALSTGVQICTHFGGNPALALMLTVGSNLLSIVTIPAFVTFFLGNDVKQLSLDAFVLFKSLVKSILIPMLLGIALRSRVPSISKWVDANRKVLSTLSALLLISVPLAELSISVSKGLILTPGELLQVAGLGVLFPTVFILFNLITTSVFCKNVQGDIRKTIVIVCSLKTLPSAVMVIQKMQEIIPTLSGVALIPCMMFHIIQTLVISAFASNNKMSSRLV